MSIGPQALARAPDIALLRFGADLSFKGRVAAPIPSGLEVLDPIYVLPDAGVLALLGPEGKGDKGAPVSAGPLELGRWSASGRQTLRQRLDVRGPVVASRLAADGSIVVVNSSEIVRVDGADGTVRERRALPQSIAKAGTVLASERGVWAVFIDRVVYFGLDGHDVTRNAPIGTPSPGRNDPPAINFQVGAVTARGELLVVESYVIDYPVAKSSSPDDPRQLQASLIGLDGKTMAHEIIAGARERREWFPLSDGNSFLSIRFPIGFTRIRHVAEMSARAVRECPGDGFLVITDDASDKTGTPTLLRLGPGLDARWRLSLGETNQWPQAFWAKTRGALLFDWYYSLTAVSDAGTKTKVATHEGTIVRDIAPMRSAQSIIGAAPGGDWLLVQY